MDYQAIAQTILRQIEVGVRMSIGWRMQSGLYGKMHGGPSYSFDAKPRNRIRRIVITLDPSDTYSIRVGDRKTGEVIFHREDVYADQLNRALLDLETTPKV